VAAVGVATLWPVSFSFFVLPYPNAAAYSAGNSTTTTHLVMSFELILTSILVRLAGAEAAPAAQIRYFAFR
jgi:hypothetical protein